VHAGVDCRPIDADRSGDQRGVEKGKHDESRITGFSGVRIRRFDARHGLHDMIYGEELPPLKGAVLPRSMSLVPTWILAVGE
jgi:hypothetical protein